MILTESKLRELTSQAIILNEAQVQTRHFSESNKRLSVFLSHKHNELEYLERVRFVLESLNASVYVDWADPSMQHPTDRRTAEALKKKIERYDKFIFIASDATITSKWCNWEIGYGDAYKYKQDKIALFPIKQDDREWKGNEYLQLYPSIEYFDGTTKYKSGKTIPEGFYVYYHFKNTITPLADWISK